MISKHRWDAQTLFAFVNDAVSARDQKFMRSFLMYVVTDCAKSSGKSEESCLCLRVTARLYCTPPPPARRIIEHAAKSIALLIYN